MNKKKCLITSGTSFFVSSFIRKAIYEKQPYEFISVDKVVNPEVLKSLYINKDHKFYMGDPSDQHFMNIIFSHEKPDLVIHGAAESSDLINSNIAATQVILDNCLRHEVKRIIYLSTDKVYGSLKNDKECWPENGNVNPENYYAVNKVANEFLIKASGLNYQILRYCNLYGFRQEVFKLIPKTIKAILNKEKITLYNQGLETRNWLHIYDACAALLYILNSDTNRTYNISSGQEFTNIEIVQKICNIMEAGHNLISYLEDPDQKRAYRRSMGSVFIKDLGWLPEFKLTDGLSETINYYQKNQWSLK